MKTKSWLYNNTDTFEQVNNAFNDFVGYYEVDFDLKKGLEKFGNTTPYRMADIIDFFEVCIVIDQKGKIQEYLDLEISELDALREKLNEQEKIILNLGKDIVRQDKLLSRKTMINIREYHENYKKKDASRTEMLHSLNNANLAADLNEVITYKEYVKLAMRHGVFNYIDSESFYEIKLYPKGFHLEDKEEQNKQYDLVKKIAFSQDTWEEYRDCLTSAGLACWVDGREYYEIVHKNVEKAGELILISK